MHVRGGFSQRTKSFIKEIGQGTVNMTDAIGQSAVNLTDAEFAMLKQFVVEKRDCDAAYVTVALVDTAHYRSPHSPTLEISSDAHVCMEENEEGIMDPERDQLKPLSASTGFETPGQQCHSSWKTGRTTAADCLTAGVGSSLEGDTSSPTEVGTRAECVGTRAECVGT